MSAASDAYFAHLPESRAVPLRLIRDTILDLYPDAEETMTYKMPTYQMGDSWIAIGNQKAHYSVYTCSSDLIEPYLRKHPEINAGKGCLRFTDAQSVDINDLRAVIVRALQKG